MVAAGLRQFEAALNQLVTTLCRPLRPDLANLVPNPAWDGQRRERYNAQLAAALLGVKVVLHRFLAGRRYIHCVYRELFKKVEAPVQPAPGAKDPPRGDSTELLELLATLTERGLYGTYEQVADAPVCRFISPGCGGPPPARN